MAARGSTGKQTKTGDAALDRVGDSLDAAQEALKDLRRGLSKGGRDVLSDLEVLVRDARKNLRGTRRTLVKDLEEVQRAVAGKRAPAAGREPARRATAARSGGTSTPRAKRQTKGTTRES